MNYSAGLKFFPEFLKSREYSGGFHVELFQSTTIDVKYNRLSWHIETILSFSKNFQSITRAVHAKL